jgi:LacI family transcriptional regulator
MTKTSIPKYLSLSEAMEGQVRTGKWRTGRLPSVRAVAQEFRVSIVTANRALQVLRDKGLLTTVQRGGYYLARADGATPAAEQFGLCLRATPGIYQRSSVNLTRAGFETVAARLGIAVADCSFELDASDRELVRQVREVGMKGLFLMPSRVSDAEMRRDERLLTACRSASVPVVLIERNLRGAGRPIEHDLIGLDDVGGAAQLTRHLLARNRKRIVMVVGSPVSTHEDRTAGYLAALHAAGPNKYSPLVLNESTAGTHRSGYAKLVDELLVAKADAVICYSDYTALGLVLDLFARGRQVPRDVAIAGFDDLPIGAQFAVGITSYALPAEGIARQAVRVMRDRIADPAAPPVRVVVPGRLIVRESTGGTT